MKRFRSKPRNPYHHLLHWCINRLANSGKVKSQISIIGVIVKWYLFPGVTKMPFRREVVKLFLAGVLTLSALRSLRSLDYLGQNPSGELDF